MSNIQITWIVVAVCGVAVLAAFALLIARPAWGSYTRTWERVAALFLSVYVLLAFAGIGVAGGLAVVWFWDRLTG